MICYDFYAALMWFVFSILDAQKPRALGALNCNACVFSKQRM